MYSGQCFSIAFVRPTPKGRASHYFINVDSRQRYVNCGHGDVMPQVYLKLQESCSELTMLQEGWPQSFPWPFVFVLAVVGQMVKAPQSLNRDCLNTSLSQVLSWSYPVSQVTVGELDAQ